MLEFASPEFLEELTLRYHAKPSCLNRSLPEAIFSFDDVSSFFVFGMVLCLDLICVVIFLSPKDIDRSILQRKP